MSRATSQRRRPTRVPLPVAAVLAALVIAGCGVDVDQAPRPVRAGTSTTTTAPQPSTGRAKVVQYFVREGTLLPIYQELSDRGLQSTLESLLVQPTPSASPPVAGLGTSIPAGTELLSLRRDGASLAIDLSGAFDNVVGRSRQQAIAQLVMTATQGTDIANVSFSVDGDPITVSSPTRGDRREVGACDFSSLLATVDDASAAGLAFEPLEVLAERRADLEIDCN